MGIGYSRRVDEQTTHVLLGRSPSSTKGLEHYAGTLMNDHQLQAALDRLEQPYLQEATAHENLEHLSTLLMSSDHDNILLAIELIKGGGFPVELIPQAFWAMKASGNKLIYKELKTILDKYLSPNGKKAIRKTFLISIDTPEDKLAKKLAKFCKNTPDLDGLDIAQQLCKYHRKGMQYIWRHSKDAALRKQVLEYFIQDHVLDLSNKGLSCLPKEIADYKNIKTALLKGNHFGTVPPVLSKLSLLEQLDLSMNYKMRDLSDRLLNMPALRDLNLYGFPYWNTPKIKKMAQLEKLILCDRPYEKGPDGPVGITKALPHCAVQLLP